MSDTSLYSFEVYLFFSIVCVCGSVCLYSYLLLYLLLYLFSRAEGSTPVVTGLGTHPLLAPCLNGLAKFSHLIDLDFMGDLMNHLKKLAGAGSDTSSPSEKCSKNLTVTERLQCCVVAFKVMRNNLDALNVDLQDFFVQLYNLILEYRPGRLVLKMLFMR